MKKYTTKLRLIFVLIVGAFTLVLGGCSNSTPDVQEQEIEESILEIFEMAEYIPQESEYEYDGGWYPIYVRYKKDRNNVEQYIADIIEFSYAMLEQYHKEEEKIAVFILKDSSTVDASVMLYDSDYEEIESIDEIEEFIVYRHPDLR